MRENIFRKDKVATAISKKRKIYYLMKMPWGVIGVMTFLNYYDSMSILRTLMCA